MPCSQASSRWREGDKDDEDIQYNPDQELDFQAYIIFTVNSIAINNSLLNIVINVNYLFLCGSGLPAYFRQRDRRLSGCCLNPR